MVPPAGGYGAPPRGYATSDDRTWALIAHFGGAGAAFVTGGVLGWLAPLIAMVTKGNESPTVKAHSLEALNFQITWSIATVVAWVVYLCGSVVTLGFGALILWILPLATVAIAVIFPVIAGVKASNGEPYVYPMSAKMIK
jgi:hypothetical protein